MLYGISMLAWRSRRAEGTLRTRMNMVAIAWALRIVGLHKARRGWRHRTTHRTQSGLAVGVDVDGVLADQISGVLPKIEQELGFTLRPEDITHWRLPIGDSDIGQEILKAEQSRNYVLSVKPHAGARSLMQWLAVANRIIVITARKGQAQQWTREWLKQQRIPFHELVPGVEAQKSVHGTDVLIDDYLGNVLEYLKNTPGVGVLVDQPWNRDRDALNLFVQQGRAFVAKDLAAVRQMWPEIRAAALARKCRMLGYS